MTCVAHILAILDSIVIEHLLIPRRCSYKSQAHELFEWLSQPEWYREVAIAQFLKPRAIKCFRSDSESERQIVKATGRSYTYSAHSIEVTIKAHLSPWSLSAEGSRDTCVPEEGFETDRRSKEGQVESQSMEASHPWGTRQNAESHTCFSELSILPLILTSGLSPGFPIVWL